MIKKYLIIAIAFVIFSGFVGAIQLGINPGKIDYEIDAGKTLCKNVTITTSSSNLVLTGEDMWSDNKKSRNLDEYNKKAGDFNLKISYEKNIIVNTKKNVNICVVGSKSGTYSGAISYKSNDVGVVSWISVEIRGNSKDINSPITGNIINNSFINSPLFPLSLSAVVSLFALLYLLALTKRKKREENEGDDKEKSEEVENSENKNQEQETKEVEEADKKKSKRVKK